MKHVWVSNLAICVALCLCNLSFGQGFSLEIQGGGTLGGAYGSTVTGTCVCVLNPDGTKQGAQGWSISVGAENASITGISLLGTDVESLFVGGFQSSQTTPSQAVDPDTGALLFDDDGNPVFNGPGVDECFGFEGAVSSVVLSETNGATLPVDSPSTIAILEVSATIPQGGGTATLSYVNGCQGNAGPVSNTISVGDEVITPEVIPHTIELVGSGDPVPSCTDKNSVGFSEVFVQGNIDFLNILGVGDITSKTENCAAAGEVTKEGAAGTKVQGCVYVNLIEARFDRAQGWSFSLEVQEDETDGMDFDVVDLTTNGTVAEPNQLLEPDGVTPCLGANSFPNCVRQNPSSPGLWSGGFNSTGIIETNKEILAVEKCPKDGTDPFTGDSCEPGSDPEILMEDPKTGDLIREPRFVICPKDGVDPISGGSCNPGDIVIEEVVNVGKRGCVSAIVLSLTLPVVVGAGTSSVLKITYEATVPDGNGGGAGVTNGQVGCLRFVDGLIGDGQPVGNVITIEGNAGEIFNFGTAEFCLNLEPISVQTFQRGNVNDDARLDIADIIYLVQWKFLSALPAPVCEDAADVNNDGAVDMTDIASIVDYLFSGGLIPTDATNGGSVDWFPVCAADPEDLSETPDGLTCLGSSACQ